MEYKIEPGAHPDNPCHCNTPKTGPANSPPASSATLTRRRNARCSCRLQECPTDSQIGVVAVKSPSRTSEMPSWIPSRSTTSLQPPDQAGLTAFTVAYGPSLTELTPARVRLRPPGRDEGPAARLHRLRGEPCSSGACRPRPSTTPSAGASRARAETCTSARSMSATRGRTSRTTNGRRNRNAAGSRRAACVDQSGNSVPLQPDDVRRPADERIRNHCLRPRNGKDQRRLPGDHRLRPAEFQPEPFGQADDDRHRLRERAGRQPERAAVLECADPVAIRDQVHNRDSSGRLLDQPQRRGREDDVQRRGSELRLGGRRPCPEFAKIGTTSVDSSALPGPIQGYLYLGEPLPGNRYRMILTADGFATHVKIAGSIHPDPQTGRLTFSVPQPAAEPADRFRPALCSDRSAASSRRPPVRHLCRRKHLHTLGRRARGTERDPVLHSRPRARRVRLPELSADSRAHLQRLIGRQHSRGAQPLLGRTGTSRWRPVPDRARCGNSTGVLRDVEGDPLLPRRGDRPAHRARIHRSGGAGVLRMSRQRARSGRLSPEPAPEAARSTPGARSTSPGPTRARL